MADNRGLVPETIGFLRNLAVNNNKEWFDLNKEDYRRYLMAPLEDLALSLAPTIAEIDPGLVTLPHKAISRIYRDTRFSRDKSPYKTTMWLTYKRPLQEWQDAPAYFFEITPDSYRFGMGFYLACKETMDSLRAKMDDSPGEFSEAVAFYATQHTFTIAGDKYKKPLNDKLPKEFVEWYQRKNLYLVCNREIDNILFSERLVDELKAGFMTLAPLYHFFHRLKK